MCITGASAQAALAAAAERTIPDKRRLLLEELDRHGQATETAASLGATTLMAASAARGERFADPRAALDSLRKRLEPFAREQVRAAYVFIYSSVPDADLEAYVGLHRQPVSAKMMPVFAGIMVRALSNAMGEFFQGLQALDKAPKGV